MRKNSAEKSRMSGLSVNGFILAGRERNFLTHMQIFLESCQCAYQRIRFGFCFRDTWDIDRWFPPVMRGMLIYLRDHRHGSPALPGDDRNIQSLENEDLHEAWTKTLNHMIFLLDEMQEETCSKKNRYEDEYMQCLEEFEKRYGIFGEGLRTPEEIEEEKKGSGHRMHMMSEVPEYREISEAYHKESDMIDHYRVQCKNEFFVLFSRYFYDLWD